ncbi:hypothetical protein ACJMK2_037908 [Sinanodonta woodiana]|uniref:Uncharacterized protein n=1 Tax=Sinanodonta woodiana TaxID=1069815 RepID=A0ABD3WNR5_SINWO
MKNYSRYRVYRTRTKRERGKQKIQTRNTNPQTKLRKETEMFEIIGIHFEGKPDKNGQIYIISRENLTEEQIFEQERVNRRNGRKKNKEKKRRKAKDDGKI